MQMKSKRGRKPKHKKINYDTCSRGLLRVLEAIAEPDSMRHVWVANPPVLSIAVIQQRGFLCISPLPASEGLIYSVEGALCADAWTMLPWKSLTPLLDSD